MHKFAIMLTISLTVFVSGCSSPKKRVTIQAAPTKNQVSAFMRGGVKLSSTDNKTEMTLVDYSDHEMVVALSVKNETDAPVMFSDQNITARHLYEGKSFRTKVYSYEELLAEYQNSSYSPMMQVGTTAVSIGTSFIPYGGIAMSLGSLLFSLAEQGVSHKDRINSLVASQLNQLYLRQHTIDPDTEYGGILKIGFKEELRTGDKVLFNVSVGEKIESFSFVCR